MVGDQFYIGLNSLVVSERSASVVAVAELRREPGRDVRTTPFIEVTPFVEETTSRSNQGDFPLCKSMFHLGTEKADDE